MVMLKNYMQLVAPAVIGIGIVAAAVFSAVHLNLAGRDFIVRDPLHPQDTFRPDTLIFKLATSTAEWQPRDSAASFIFQDKIWLMGGLNGNSEVDGEHNVRYWEAPHFNDIWSTNDGEVWTLEQEHAAWHPRRSMSVLYFRGSLWMFGGWSPISGYGSDIWQSDDGINWIRVLDRAPWSPREGQTAEIFNEKMWVFGGVNYDERKVKNDVWFSSDGITWLQATTAIPWSPRWDHATAVFNNKLYLTGGMNLNTLTFQDVWISSDGLEWEEASEPIPWQARQGHGLVEYKGHLYSLGRLNDTTVGGLNDIWFTKDGVVWEKTLEDPLWEGREDHSALLFRDRMYVFGGMDKAWRWRNDVWVSK